MLSLTFDIAFYILWWHCYGCNGITDIDKQNGLNVELSLKIGEYGWKEQET